MARALTRSLARGWVRPRPASAHKGSSGRVFIIAGSRGMAGAAVLCASAAARGGAGLVRLGIVKSQQNAAVKRAPLEITTAALPENRGGRLAAGALPAIKKEVSHFAPHVIAVGPGLGVSPVVEKLVLHLLYQSDTSVVLDADGLNALAASGVRRRFRCRAVITPHPGELARLLKISTARIAADREGWAKKAARLFGCVCLLKGPGTLITDGTETWKNATGNPAMASGGMGDILTGLIAALWAQAPVRDLRVGFQAAALGAYWHGLAAGLALRRFPEGSMLASDVIDYFPNALKKLKEAS